MNTRLMVLGLLFRTPLHGYDVRKQLELMRTDLWADVLPGSIYHALKQMQREGLVEVQATEATGHRLRAIYAITDAGKSAYLDLLRQAWVNPPQPFPTGLYAAVTFLSDLPQEEGRHLVQALIPAVQRELEVWCAGQVAKEQAGVLTPATRLLFVNAREHLEADLRLLHRLQETFAEGE